MYLRFFLVPSRLLLAWLLSVCLFAQSLVGSVFASDAGTTVTTVIAPMLLDDGAASNPTPPSSSNNLFQINQLQYKGAFRFAAGNYGGQGELYSVNYAVGTLAYNPNNHSLFVAGHAQGSRVAEFPIPIPGMQAAVQNLPVSAAPLQNFRSVFPSSNDQGINRVTGMLVYNNALIINAENWYDAGGTNTDTTLVVPNANNLSGAINGFYRLNGRANSAGYMGEIPASLRGMFGGANYYTGWSSVYSIVSRYSYGPSLWTFNPADLLQGAGQNIGATPFMNFSFSSQLEQLYDSYDPSAQASPLWNLLSDGVYGFFVPRTKTFAVLGSHGGIHSGFGYKITQTNGNVCGGHCTYDPADNYNYYWLYNVDDIVAASGLAEPRPYALGKLELPFDNNGSRNIIGATIDAASGTLYIALEYAGQVGIYDRPPLILVYGFAD